MEDHKTMANDFTEDLRRRDERVRTETFNGREYTIQCTDPFALWHIHGPVANELQGTYTTPERAWSAIKAYETAKASKAERTIISTSEGKKTKVKLSELQGN